MNDPTTEFDFERTVWCHTCRERVEVLFTGHTDSAYAHAQCPECDAVLTIERDMPSREGGRRRIRETTNAQRSARAEAVAARTSVQ